MNGQECDEHKGIIDRLPWPVLGPLCYLAFCALIMVLLLLFNVPADHPAYPIASLIIGAALTRVKFAGTKDNSDGP
jgi:hypothetical protein